MISSTLESPPAKSRKSSKPWVSKKKKKEMLDDGRVGFDGGQSFSILSDHDQIKVPSPSRLDDMQKNDISISVSSTAPTSADDDTSVLAKLEERRILEAEEYRARLTELELELEGKERIIKERDARLEALASIPVPVEDGHSSRLAAIRMRREDNENKLKAQFGYITPTSSALEFEQAKEDLEKANKTIEKMTQEHAIDMSTEKSTHHRLATELETVRQELQDATNRLSSRSDNMELKMAEDMLRKSKAKIDKLKGLLKKSNAVIDRLYASRKRIKTRLGTENNENRSLTLLEDQSNDNVSRKSSNAAEEKKFACQLEQAEAQRDTAEQRLAEVETQHANLLSEIEKLREALVESEIREVQQKQLIAEQVNEINDLRDESSKLKLHQNQLEQTVAEHLERIKGRQRENESLKAKVETLREAKQKAERAELLEERVRLAKDDSDKLRGVLDLLKEQLTFAGKRNASLEKELEENRKRSGEVQQLRNVQAQDDDNKSETARLTRELSESQLFMSKAEKNHQRALSEKAIQISSLEASLQAAEKGTIMTQKQLEEQQAKIVALSKELSASRVQVEELNNQQGEALDNGTVVDQLEQALREAESRVNSLEAKLEEKMTENDQLDQSLCENREVFGRLEAQFREENDRKEAQLLELEAMVSENEREKGALQQRIESLESSVDATAETRSEAATENLRAEIDSLENELKASQQREEEQAARSSDLLEQNELYKQQLADQWKIQEELVKENKQRMLEMEEKMNAANTSSDEQNQQLSQTEQRNKALISQLQEYETRVEALTSSATILTRQIEANEEKISELQKTDDGRKEELQVLESELCKATESTQDKIESIKIMKNENAELLEKLAEQQASVDEMRSSTAILLEQVNATQNEKARGLQMQEDEYRDRLESLEHDLKSAQTNKLKKAEELDEMKAENQSLVEKVASTAEQVDHWKTSSTTLAEQLAEAQSLVECLEKLKEELHSRVGELEEELETAIEKTKHLEEDCAAFRKENHSLNQSVETSRNEITMLKSSTASLFQQLEAAENQVQHLTEKEMFLENESEKNSSLFQELASLKTELEEIEREQEIVTEHNVDLQTQIASRDAELSSCQQKLEESQKAVVVLEEIAAKAEALESANTGELKDQLDRMATKLTISESQCLVHQNEVAAAEEQLRNANAKVEVLESKISHQESQDKNGFQQESFSAVASSLRKELDVAKARADKAERKVEGLETSQAERGSVNLKEKDYEIERLLGDVDRLQSRLTLSQTTTQDLREELNYSQTKLSEVSAMVQSRSNNEADDLLFEKCSQLAEVLAERDGLKHALHKTEVEAKALRHECEAKGNLLQEMSQSWHVAGSNDDKVKRLQEDYNQSVKRATEMSVDLAESQMEVDRLTKSLSQARQASKLAGEASGSKDNGAIGWSQLLSRASSDRSLLNLSNHGKWGQKLRSGSNHDSDKEAELKKLRQEVATLEGERSVYIASLSALKQQVRDLQEKN